MSAYKRILVGCIGVLGAVALFLTSPVVAQQAPALNPFDQPIDNIRYYRHYERIATQMMNEDTGAVARLLEKFKNAPQRCSLAPNEIEAHDIDASSSDRTTAYQHLVKSTVMLGELYDCGRCDKTHVRFAGAVMIGSDGLMLTNHHVFSNMDATRTKGTFAMTWDGKVWPIEEVLFTDEIADAALVRLKGDGHKFHAARLAEKAPGPMDTVRVMSHPSGEFFVMTHGEVSRYITRPKKRTRANPQIAQEHWMEITAPFGAGSSGSGVFNEAGEVVGLVSRIHPLMRRSSTKSKAPIPKDATKPTTTKPVISKPPTSFVEMVLRRCVPLEEIREGLAPVEAVQPVSIQ